MILAAGRGERMRPLTDTTPKPLLDVRGKPLIVWQIEALVRAGWRDLVINLAHLGHKIEDRLGDGSAYGSQIRYSHEEAALETAGGIAQARQLLGEDPFLVVNSDIFCDFDYSQLLRALDGMREDKVLAHLVLVENPEHHVGGDFSLVDGKVTLHGKEILTFSGIGLYHPALFRNIVTGTAAKLGPLLRQAVDAGKVTGIRHDGLWVDVGTPERLGKLNSPIS